MEPDLGKEKVTVAEAVRITGRTRGAIHWAIKQGQLPWEGEDRVLRRGRGDERKMGKAYYEIPRDALMAWAELRGQSSDDVVRLARKLVPLARLPRDTKFGRRVWDHSLEKRLVASRVALDFFTDDTKRALIADGSSAYWVTLGLLERQLALTVETNNWAAGLEARLRPWSKIEIEGPEGKWDHTYAGIFGEKADEFCRAAARNADVSIMPVTALTFEDGPYAAGAGARSIKQAVIPVARCLVIVLDSSKIRPSGLKAGDRVLLPEEWQRTLKDPSLHIVCDVPDEMPHAIEEEILKFRGRLGPDQFIEVKTTAMNGEQ